MRYTSEDIRKHPCFSSIDFDLLLQKKVEPPWKPPSEIAANVDNEFLEEDIDEEDSSSSSAELFIKRRLEFDSFSFVAERSSEGLRDERSSMLELLTADQMVFNSST